MNRRSSDSHLIPLLERANRIAATPDLDHLLDQTLALLIEICGAEAGALYWLVDSSQTLVCMAGDSGEFGPRLDLRGSLAEEALQQARPIRRDNLPGGRFHRLVSLPLLREHEPLGVVQLFDFTQPAFDLAQLLADRMCAEIDRSIQLEASQQHNRRLEALIAILGQIGSSLDRDQILRVIINSAREFLGAEACSLFLVDEVVGDLVLAIASNVNDRVSVEQTRLPAGMGIIGHVVQTGETMLVADAALDERHYGEMDRNSEFVTRSLLAIPLRSRMVDLGAERGVTHERIIGPHERRV